MVGRQFLIILGPSWLWLSQLYDLRDLASHSFSLLVDHCLDGLVIGLQVVLLVVGCKLVRMLMLMVMVLMLLFTKVLKVIAFFSDG